jgi:hypothetical protein
VDAVQPEHLEAIPYDSLGRLGAVALLPKGCADPIAQFGMGMRLIDA